MYVSLCLLITIVSSQKRIKNKKLQIPRVKKYVYLYVLTFAHLFSFVCVSGTYLGLEIDAKIR